MKLKVLELFGGIGACTKALKKIGIDVEIVDYVEIDKFAVKSFNAINSTNFEPQDICEWDKDIEVDLIVHGSPCQDISVSGLGKGADKGSGTRSSLMYETIRIVQKLKPKYVIWENVKNLISKKHIHNFQVYLDDLEKIGYKNYYKVLNTKDYGIPQNRERVFTVSILNNELLIDKSVKPSVAKNFEREKDKIINTKLDIYNCECNNGWQDNKVGINLAPTIRANNNNTYILEQREFTFPKKVELKLKLSDFLEKEVEKKFYLDDSKYKIESDNDSIKIIFVNGSYARKFGSRGKLQKNICNTLTASMGTGGGNVPLVKILKN